MLQFTGVIKHLSVAKAIALHPRAPAIKLCSLMTKDALQLDDHRCTRCSLFAGRRCDASAFQGSPVCSLRLCASPQLVAQELFHKCTGCSLQGAGTILLIFDWLRQQQLCSMVHASAQGQTDTHTHALAHMTNLAAHKIHMQAQRMSMDVTENALSQLQAAMQEASQRPEVSRCGHLFVCFSLCVCMCMCVCLQVCKHLTV
jgi:hypothetical protein